MRCLRWSWLWVLPACTPNTGGAGSGAANTVAAPTSGADTTESTDGSTDDDPSAGTADGSATGSGATTNVATTVPPSGAFLVLSNGPEYDFGQVALGVLRAGSLTLTNVGDEEATGISGDPLAAGPFSYTGGMYPGAGGTCSDTLAAGAACELDLSFVPATPGLFATTLALTYDQGDDPTRDITGAGNGESDNLLVNPGGEQGGSPPMGWTNDGAGSWGAGDPQDITPHSGDGTHYGDGGPFFQDFVLFQSVDVSSWTSTIDQGVMGFAFDGHSRVLSTGNDQSRFIMRFLDGGGGVLDSWDDGWRVDASWTHRNQSGTLPSGTRNIRVELRCTKNFGDRCNAYFDSLNLRVQYP